MSQYDTTKILRDVKVFVWVLMIVSAALALGSMLAYIGPFAWFAELQLKFVGSYGEVTTFLATFFVFLPVVYFLAKPFLHLFSGKQAPGRTSSISIAEFKVPIMIGCAGLLLMAYSGREYYVASRAGALTSLDLTKLEAGQAPESGWVTAAGRALPQDAVRFGKAGSEDLFVPICSANRQGDVHLFVKSPHEKPFNGGVAKGMLHHDDLPGPVRASMEKSGLLHGSDYYVLDTDEEPAMEMRVSQTFIETGGGIFAVGLIAAAVTYARRKPSRS